jgi:hypothetical protein
MLHEPESPGPLTTVPKLRQRFREQGIEPDAELGAVASALGLEGELDNALREDLARWFEAFFRNLMDPAGTFKFPSDLSPLGGPMISLRDVEEQAPILGLVER